MKRIIFLIVAVFCCCSVSAQELPNEFYARVVGISDGDTFKVLYQENQEIKIRLGHIDAPEIVRQSKDRYQRIIAEVFIGKTNVNKEIVRAGYAWHFKKYSSDKEYEKIENEARENKRGLWQDKTSIAPWVWRDIKKTKKSTKKVLLFDCVL